MTSYRDLVQTSTTIGATRKRSEKVAALADFLRVLPTEDLRIAVAHLSGQPTQDRLDVGWAAVQERTPAPSDTASLTLSEVDAAFEAVAGQEGSGSRTGRLDVLEGLLGRATADEQDFLRRLVLGELRQGANEGVMIQAIAGAFGAPEPSVRRAVMLSADPGGVAVDAKRGGTEALDRYRLEVGRPVQPMLASTASSTREAIENSATPTLVERKLDGARIQVHRDGDHVIVVTRSLRDVTAHVPEIVEAVRRLEVRRVVLDGEALVLGTDGRPAPFQDTMSRFGRSSGSDQTDQQLSPFFFDVLHVDGRDLLDEPLSTRYEILQSVVPAHVRAPAVMTRDPDEADRFLRETLEAGHEGVMVKDVSAVYSAGRRGAAWRKVKPVHTLDLVVLAAEWGSGRRRGWLSNLHLGARDPDSADFVMLGKTFKGLSDDQLAWQTERFLELERRRTERTVYVEPVQVVEIAFDGVQTSSRYPGGVTLRFARVVRYREDKRAEEADTLQTVQAIHRGEIRPDVPS